MINNDVLAGRTVRRATLADLESIMELERAGFDPAEQWTAAAWTAELTGDDRRVVVAETGDQVASDQMADDHELGDQVTDDRIVGVITVQVLVPESDLLRVVVAADQRRRGIAGELIDAAVGLAAADGARWMMLEVRYDNDAAIACYGRAGFEQLTTRDDYYGPGSHALIMKRYELAAEAVGETGQAS
ncbi:GNAT family N-acetyltransferase [Microlunatus sp. Y2014]|uniref:GNAT family N-acetyltransferase n=1 Tax=Microlunatus sp. Y2014 TaxID=3418488 RepID=UPI003DA6D38B